MCIVPVKVKHEDNKDMLTSYVYLTVYETGL